MVQYGNKWRGVVEDGNETPDSAQCGIFWISEIISVFLEDSRLIVNINHSIQDSFKNFIRPKDIKHKTALLLRTRTNTDSGSDRSSWTAWDQMSSRAVRVVNYVIWQACMNDALRHWDTATSTRVPFFAAEHWILQSKDHTSFLVVLMPTGMQHGHAWRTD